MKLLVFILKKTEKLGEILRSLSKNNLNEVTILKSSGMIKSIDYDNKESNAQNLIINSLKIILSQTENYSVTIISVVNESEEKKFIYVVEKVLGNLKNKKSGILFTLPICSLCGLN